MSLPYTIIFKNNSNIYGNACILLDKSMIWLTGLCNPMTQCKFTWPLVYDAIWSLPSNPTSEVTINTQQVVEIGPDFSNYNGITLDYENGAFLFTNHKNETPAGQLIITGTNTIPVGKAFVGFGMAGAPGKLITASPNVVAYFEPTHPTYYMTLGMFTAGQSVPFNTPLTQVAFPNDIYTMYVTVDNTGKWTVSTLPE